MNDSARQTHFGVGSNDSNGSSDHQQSRLLGMPNIGSGLGIDGIGLRGGGPKATGKAIDIPATTRRTRSQTTAANAANPKKTPETPKKAGLKKAGRKKAAPKKDK